MTKISLIAIIWVWNCVVYGQLSANNPYYFPYIPYTSTFVTHQSHNHQNYDKTVDQSAGNAGELLGRGIPFQIALFIKMQDLEATTADLAKQLKDLKDELETKATKDDLAKKADQSQLDQTNTELQTTSNDLATTRTELSDTKSDVEDLTIKLNALTTGEIVDIGRLPANCSDLQLKGHKLGGFFSVKGSVKMEMIYCDFFPNQIVNEIRIGYTDVKWEPVYFYVQRNSSFNTASTPIPFQVEVANEGDAMNLAAGIFTAPRTGTYFFSFVGVARFPISTIFASLSVTLYLNATPVGRAYVSKFGNPSGVQFSPLSTLQSTLKLTKEDVVWVELLGTTGMSLIDYDKSIGSPLTHFTGILLEQEIDVALL